MVTILSLCPRNRLQTINQLKELKHLQQENELLSRAMSDLMLNKLILTEAARQGTHHLQRLRH